jgi:predicted ATPase
MEQSMLETLRIRNFKAITDTGLLRLTPLTVLIGNNGSGKSSVLEALETLQVCVDKGLDAAMQMWRGIEHVRNKSGAAEAEGPGGEPRPKGPIVIALTRRVQPDGSPVAWRIHAMTAWSERKLRHGAGQVKRSELFFGREAARVRYETSGRGGDGGPLSWQELARNGNDIRDEKQRVLDTLRADMSLLGMEILGLNIEDWQFVSLSPQTMGEPTPQTRSSRRIGLAKDGANVAEFLQDIRNSDPAAFAGIIETLRTVLPYADDLQPALTSELERTVYLQLAERNFKVPGWLLSTGTLRILALLALLRHPNPPPLIAIEEIENGLDPRTVHLLVEEIHTAVEAGRTQVIATTHSPYLLDLLPLSAIIFVERIGDEPRFSRPAGSKEVREWAKNFAPGQLYTMQRLHGEARS